MLALAPLGMIGIQPHVGPDDEDGIALAVETVRGAAPMLVSTGVATAKEIGMETLEQRLRHERHINRAVGASYMPLGASATTGAE